MCPCSRLWGDLDYDFQCSILIPLLFDGHSFVTPSFLSPPRNSSVRGSPLDIFVSLLFTCAITSNGLSITIVRSICGVQPGTLNFAHQASIHCDTIQPAALLNPGFFASDFFELCNYSDMHTCRKPRTHVLPTQ